MTGCRFALARSEVARVHPSVRPFPRTFARTCTGFVTAHCMLPSLADARIVEAARTFSHRHRRTGDSATAGTAGKKERVMDARTRTILEMGRRALAFAE